jgi:hypothetical protein
MHIRTKLPTLAQPTICVLHIHVKTKAPAILTIQPPVSESSPSTQIPTGKIFAYALESTLGSPPWTPSRSNILYAPRYAVLLDLLLQEI